MKRRTSDENSILERIQARLADSTKSAAGRSLVLQMGDDAALFRPKVGFETILTCDWFLEGTHFLRAKHPPDSVGWKCLVRAMSDVAAMGGVPRCFLLSLAMPESHTGRWFDALLGGLLRGSPQFAFTFGGGGPTRRRGVLFLVYTATGGGDRPAAPRVGELRRS